MRAGFSDLIRYPASFIRAKPAIGYGGGTNEIRRMVDLAGITIPKMRAVFSRLQPQIIAFAVKCTARACLTERIRTVTNGTIPGVVAFRIRVVSLPAIEAIPVIIRTGFIRGVVFIASRARPIMIATVAF